MQQPTADAEDYSIEDLNRLIESIKRKTGLTEEGIARHLKYNEGYIAQTRSRGKVSVKFTQALQSLLKTGLQNATNEKSDTEPTPMQLMKIIIDTNENIRKDHSELIQLHKQIVATNAKLADSNNELAKKIPEQPIENVQQQKEPVEDATRSAFLELISLVGSGKRFHSSEEVKTVYRKLVSDLLVPIGGGDTRKNLNKRRNMK